VPQRDAAAFAAAIAAVAGDDARRRAFGVAARARFERCFDVRVTEKPLHERIRAVLTDRD
jgi:glycosyltransferase involved in cell wall biosynthesis